MQTNLVQCGTIPGKMAFTCQKALPQGLLMDCDPDKPVTHWVNQLRTGDPAAAQNLWQEYFARLVHLARARLKATGVDDEVVAASAFNSFCMAAMDGRFPSLEDRHDLWQLLIYITSQKATNHLRKQQAVRRGGNAVFENHGALEQVISPEPTPEFAAMMIDEFEHLLARLGSERLQRIAIMKMEGYTHEEIAEKLDCAVRTVAYKLDYIRERLNLSADRD